MPRKNRRVEAPKPSRTVRLTITELGARGDGIAPDPDGGGSVYVPLTVPGDEIEAQVVGTRATSFELLKSGEARRDPPCPHFSECGGCTLQHLSEQTYRQHKEDVLASTFSQAGIEPFEFTSIWGHDAARRRTTLSARGRKKGAILGYQKAGSHQLTPIDQCLILTKGLQDALPHVRTLASGVLEPGEEASISLTEYENGIDLSLVLDPAVFKDRRLSLLQTLGSAAGAFNITRIAVNGEPALVARAPIIHFGGVAVSPPFDAFLQPGLAGEKTLTQAVLDAKPAISGGRAVDLFSGCGTFSLPLAKDFEVIAYESVVGQVEALARSAKSAGLPGLKTLRRDLIREPLGDLELRKVDYVVLNPPRAGARQQCQELAKSKVSTITYISCNPGTLARDAIILMQGGYELKSATLLDQFIYSAHSECVAIFEKPQL